MDTFEMRSFRAAIAAVLLVAMMVPVSGQAGGGGCAISVTYVNRKSTQSKVDQGESEVKSKQFGFWGSWASIGWADGQTGTIKVAANSQKTRAYQLLFKRSYPRRYRFTVLNGGNSKTVYKPSSTGQTTSVNLTVTINFWPSAHPRRGTNAASPSAAARWSGVARTTGP